MADYETKGLHPSLFTDERTNPTALSDGDTVVVDARGMAVLKIKPGAGATVTWSEVDTHDAGSHASTTTDVTEDTEIDVTWPYYRISTAGGSAKVGAV